MTPLGTFRIVEIVDRDKDMSGTEFEIEHFKMYFCSISCPLPHWFKNWDNFTIICLNNLSVANHTIQCTVLILST